MSLRVLAHIARRGPLFLLSLLATACAPSIEEFAQSLAEQECAFAQRCSPERFETRCRPCQAHSECATGACEFVSGRCKDALGRPLPGLSLQAPCTQAQGCGGYVCAPWYANQTACASARRLAQEAAVQRFLAHEQDPARGCPFAPALAEECLRESEHRKCGEDPPRSCALTLRDCT